MQTRARRALCTGTFTLVAIGCSTEAPPARTEPTITTVDGVRVVDNHAPRWSDDEHWRISAEPILTLGVDAGAPAEMFTYPTPIRLDNGTIVVAGFPDTDSVWDVFSPDGIWLGSVELIPGRTVEQIGDDQVLISGEDDDGVARVRLYGLIKEGGYQR